MNDSVLFSRVMEEYGSHEKDADEKEEKIEEKAEKSTKEKSKKVGLMQEEERMTGSVAGEVYSKYFRFAGGMVRLPIILLLLAGYQGAQGESVYDHFTPAYQADVICSGEQLVPRLLDLAKYSWFHRW